jgi:uncharacterized phage-associated protein
MLYYAQGWHLAFFDFPLFEDNIYAWKYGPVIHSVYHNYKHQEPQATITEYMPGCTFKDNVYHSDVNPVLEFNNDDCKQYMNN